MKFLVDMPLSPDLAAWLRTQGHEAVHAAEIGLSQASDESLLRLAQDEERIVVTADLDFARLFSLSVEYRPGLVLFRRGDFSEAESIRMMSRALETVAAGDFGRSIVVIERSRIRIRTRA